MPTRTSNPAPKLEKCPSGIGGLDEICNGGFPKGRPALICGSAGCGKTLMAMQFLVKGILEYGEPGVFMSFEESSADLATNVSSLGFDLPKLQRQNMLKMEYVRIERSEIEETGEYDLEGLFIRLNYAIDTIGAKRVVLDTIEALFSGMQNLTLLRSEIRRLFEWLKHKGVTALITGERGASSLTRHGLEEYVSDCVILLDFRVIDQIATRRLRIVKYRGSTHGTNEYPFLIDETGISVIPITSLKLDYRASNKIFSTGLPAFDALFGAGGFYKGSSILLTGVAGTAKTILAAQFALSSCRRNERVLYFSFEESTDQLCRNLQSVGINLRAQIQSRRLIVHASRPSLQGLELHLLTLFRLIGELKPQMVIVDPISSMISIGSTSEVRAMLVRLIDFMKTKEINAIFTSLTQQRQNDYSDATIDAVSSLADAWLELKYHADNGVRHREVTIVKTRGMDHFGNTSRFKISKKGISLLPPNGDKKSN